MAYALVGTIGAASQGAASAAVTPAWGTSENRTVGNLLICFITCTGIATEPGTPAGWTLANVTIGTSCSTKIVYKTAAGTDAAPTIAAVTSGVIAAQLAEFSGGTVADGFGGAVSGTSSPLTATFQSADVASGELMLISSGDFRSAARTPTDTLTSNHATITQAGNNNAASSANHYSFGYSLATTSNTGANTNILTASVTTSITGLAICGITFQVTAPAGLTAQQKAGFFMFF